MKFNINNNGDIVLYDGNDEACAFNVFVLADDFKKLSRKNKFPSCKTSTMLLNDIKLTSAFANSQPKKSKMAACMNFYNKYDILDRPIILNADGYLIDGFVAYKVAQAMGMKTVKVVKVDV